LKRQSLAITSLGFALQLGSAALVNRSGHSH